MTFPAENVLLPCDLVSRVDGHKIVHAEDVSKLIGRHRPGTSAALRVVRAGRTLDGEGAGHRVPGEAHHRHLGRCRDSTFRSTSVSTPTTSAVPRRPRHGARDRRRPHARRPHRRQAHRGDRHDLARRKRSARSEPSSRRRSYRPRPRTCRSFIVPACWRPIASARTTCARLKQRVGDSNRRRAGVDARPGTTRLVRSPRCSRSYRSSDFDDLSRGATRRSLPWRHDRRRRE